MLDITVFMNVDLPFLRSHVPTDGKYQICADCIYFTLVRKLKKPNEVYFTCAKKSKSGIIREIIRKCTKFKPLKAGKTFKVQ